MIAKLRRKPKARIIIAAAALLLIASLAVSYLVSKYALTVTGYTVESAAISGSVRIVQLSDLHNASFGSGNSRLIEAVAGQKPDLILRTGDIIDRDTESTQAVCSLITALTEIAPVYASFGNHEAEHEQRWGSDVRGAYTAAGAVVLEREWADITVRSERIRIGGIFGYCLPAKYLSTGEASEDECGFLTAFTDTESLTVLMCHMPVCWIVNDGLDEWDVDLIFAGHSHGGQVRLPFVGGLTAPDRGLFPGKECGLYCSSDGERTLVLSRGLGSPFGRPRINNIPEIVTVDLVPKGDRQ